MKGWMTGWVTTTAFRGRKPEGGRQRSSLGPCATRQGGLGRTCPQPWIHHCVRCRGKHRVKGATGVTVAEEIELGLAQASDPRGGSYKYRHSPQPMAPHTPPKGKGLLSEKRPKHQAKNRSWKAWVYGWIKLRCKSPLASQAYP